MKNRAKILILSLMFAAGSVAIGSSDLSSLKKERDQIKAKLGSSSGAQKKRLMKRLARLENQITESSSADRKQSK